MKWGGVILCDEGRARSSPAGSSRHRSLADDKAKPRVAAAVARVAVARAAERRGFLLLAAGYLVAGSPLGFTARTRSPRAPPRPFTSGTGRAESPSEQNKGVCKTPLPTGETPAWEGGRGEDLLSRDAAGEGGNLPREKSADTVLTPFPPAPRV